MRRGVADNTILSFAAFNCGVSVVVERGVELSVSPMMASRTGLVLLLETSIRSADSCTPADVAHYHMIHAVRE